ncbi:hypothetical protein EUX98_g3648 [Antrodiella citrinella]|uniref:Histone deacetylase domain-containing protein n=1 Tax=Antrodiella citrinella TaxID=2447956 RepID=A0A4S4MW21_9APHY|nr:hypothetical protein EUX98_g3648 [Antrodiella citrinella]
MSNGAIKLEQRFAIFLQEACLRHQFIRSKDSSSIVERPERLRAVNIGISAALARLELSRAPKVKAESGDDDDLTAALEKLNLSTADAQTTASTQTPGPSSRPGNIVKSSATVDLLNNPAVKFVHGDIEGDVYLENLVKWARQSRDEIAKGESEIPSSLSQGDLYLCPGSIEAIQGALGTVCEAVDTVCRESKSDDTTSSTKRAFVAIRPPGHHCGEDTPSGFCFVNNVAVAAAHAHLIHGINRVVIFDVDLHHGNGTQSIVWQINEETYRNTLEESYGSSSSKPGPQVYYGSIHDILSYPCEDGKPTLVQAASTSIHGPHGQYIENIHLQTYASDKEFWEEHYEKRYSKLLSRASDFLDKTGGPGDDVLVFVSCGFDACEHEYESMQRHLRRVPTSFYHRFTRDAAAFAEKYARGRLISVLEGGYSDRALMSGAMAHVVGLSGVDVRSVDEAWWSIDNLVQLEQATKKRRGGRISQATLSSTPTPAWVLRTQEIFSTIDAAPPVTKPVVQSSSMSLRDRSLKPTSIKSNSGDALSSLSKSKPTSGKTKPRHGDDSTGSDSTLSDLTDGSRSGGDSVPASAPTQVVVPPPHPAVKKLPRVILRMGPREGST